MTSPPAYDTLPNASPTPKIVLPENVQVSSSFGAEPPLGTALPTEPPPPYPEDINDNPKLQQLSSSAEAPPLAYLDIMPRMLSPGSIETEIPPTFDSYPTVIETANQWLAANRHYMVWKCESVEKKVDKGLRVDIDSMLHHDSTFGLNVYVKGLRMWVIPKDPQMEPQRLGLLTHVPKEEAVSGAYMAYGNGFFGGAHMLGITQIELRQMLKRQNLKKTLASLNERLKTDPISGQIMNVETSWDKAREGFLLKEYDPDCMCRHEKGGSYRLYLQVIRIFYLIGQPAYEEIDIHDAVPQCSMKPNLNKPPKFQSFSETLIQAGLWLQGQQGLRVVNVVSFECPMRMLLERDVLRENSSDAAIRADVKEAYVQIIWQPNSFLNVDRDEFEIATNSTVEQEVFSLTNYFVKVVRLIFVRSKGSTASAYQSVCLTSRLFLPVRLGTKSYEPMPVTVWRIASWLKATGLQIFGVDTQRMLMTNTTRGSGVDAEKMNTTVYGMRAKYWVTGIRVFFGSVYQEPPAHLLPPVVDWESARKKSKSSSKTCNIV